MSDKSLELNPDLNEDILAFLGITAGRSSDRELLDDLVAAYTQRVPWESASRIAKKARVVDQAGKVVVRACARWPAEFWRDAIDQGTGGTCFESNYAFFALLRGLGYSGYLTVNNMESTIGCHAAIVVTIDDSLWLTDVGLPLYVPLPIEPVQDSRRESPFHGYTVRPCGSNTYQIERDHHPQPYCFTLIDTEVPEASYRQVLAEDYGPNGHFLDQVIVNRVIDGYICRFNGGERPYKLERFRRDYKDSQALGSDPAIEVARFFDLDEQLLRQALLAVDVT